MLLILLMYQHFHAQILANDQLDALFYIFIYFITLHVSNITMLIIRRSNCVNTSSGMISLCDCLVCRSGGNCFSVSFFVAKKSIFTGLTKLPALFYVRGET